MEDVVFFVHVGKASGSSLGRLLSTKFSKEQIIGDHGERDLFYGLDNLAAGNARCVMGHFCYGVHSLLPTYQRPVYITFLRDPFERILSLFFYRPDIYGQFRDVESFIVSHGRPRNMMTRQIVGYAWEPSVDLAASRLESDYACFGITERFNDSIDWISAVLGFGPLYLHENVNLAKAQFDEPTRTRLRAILQREDPLDAEVYAKAVEIFERRRVEAGQPRARLSSRPQQVLGEMPYTHPGLEKQVEAVSERVGAASQRIEDVVRHISSGTDDRLGGLRESLARIEEQLAKQTARRNFSKGVSEVPTGIEERFFRFARKSWRRAIDLLRRIKR